MCILPIDNLELDFPNSYLINKYYISDFMLGAGKAIFNDENKLNPKQEMLNLRYNAISFNLYCSMFYLDEYFKVFKIAPNNLMSLQTSNFYLQAAYDSLYQLLHFMTFNENKLKFYLKNEKKRQNEEKSLVIKDFKGNEENKHIVKLIKNFFFSRLKKIRDINNYVKHNGQLHFQKNPEINFSEIDTNNKDLLDALLSATSDVKNGESELNATVVKNKKIDLVYVSENIYISINHLCYLLNLCMEMYTDNTYLELVSKSK